MKGKSHTFSLICGCQFRMATYLVFIWNAHRNFVTMGTIQEVFQGMKERIQGYKMLKNNKIKGLNLKEEMGMQGSGYSPGKDT